MIKKKKQNKKKPYYTPVHLVESVENCGLCMRQCLASSSYAHVMHCALAIRHEIGKDASVKH